tara:strand:- start:571 stop:1107 length:537 start_codon:yes stop_codon:yes gene_type:complete
MSEKGLSNNPKVRLKVANRANTHLEYFRAKGQQHTTARVQAIAGHNTRYDHERYFPKRASNIEKSYQSGKPVKSQLNPKKLDAKLSGNANRANYSKSISRLNSFNKHIANFGNKMERLTPAFEKDKAIKTAKNVKTMGKIVKGLRNITVPGIIATIMKPTTVGDGTLKGNQGEYKKVK